MWNLPLVTMPQQPDAIVLDIEQFLPAFRWQLDPKDNYPEFVTEIVHSIICCFQHAHMAEYEITEFAAQIEFQEYDNDDGLRIKPDYSRAVLQLGLDILRHMHDLNIFDLDGKLSYEYYSYELPNFAGTVLKRIEEE